MVSITNVATPRKAGGSQPATRRSQENLRPIMVVLKPSPSPGKQASNASVQVYFFVRAVISIKPSPPPPLSLHTLSLKSLHSLIRSMHGSLPHLILFQSANMSSAPTAKSPCLFPSAVSIRHVPIRDRTGRRLLLHDFFFAAAATTTTTTTGSVPRPSSSERVFVQDHRPRAQLDPGEVGVSGDDVHEFGQLDPEDVLQGEELGAGFLVELEDFGRGEEGGRQSLRHGVAQLAPEGTVVIHGSRHAGPGSVWCVR